MDSWSWRTSLSLHPGFQHGASLSDDTLVVTQLYHSVPHSVASKNIRMNTWISITVIHQNKINICQPLVFQTWTFYTFGLYFFLFIMKEPFFTLFVRTPRFFDHKMILFWWFTESLFVHHQSYLRQNHNQHLILIKDRSEKHN